MEFNPTFDWGNLISLAAFAMGVIANIYTWKMTRRGEVDTKFEGIDERLTVGSKRMNTLELRVQHTEVKLSTLPNKDSVHSLALGISGLSADLKGVSATLDSLAGGQQRLDGKISILEDHLRGGNPGGV